jgi:hypothetical protein
MIIRPDPRAAEVLAARALHDERRAMRPFRRGLMAAMAQTPAPGDLSKAFPHMLAAYDAAGAEERRADAYASLVIWHDNVVQMVRLHPDMGAFAKRFGVSDEALDDLFRLALRIEAGAA